MLLRFAASNFRSLKDEQELSLVATSLAGHPDSVVVLDGVDEGVLRVAAIYGANASGKTNALRALHFMATAVEDSQTSWKPDQHIPRQPFRLDQSSRDKPSQFEVDIVLESTRYQYGFSVASDRVLEEWLFAFPSGRRQMWYRRKPEGISFGRNLTGENRLIERVMRRNSLFLSAAAQSNHEQLTPIYRWFSTQLAFVTSDRHGPPMETLELCDSDIAKRRIEAALGAADLGLLGFETSERPVEEATRKLFAAIQDILPSGAAMPEKLPGVRFLHRCEHNAPVTLGLTAESDGTIAFFALLGPVIKTLDHGGTLCVDELDSSLHPLLALELVGLFNDPKRNPRGAQLIFNTHDTNLLDLSILRRDQIWFTEKDKCGATHLYALTDFKPRENENLQRGYLQGRYGAVPFLKSSNFLLADGPEIADAIEAK
jgi:AAA15 family ATPase/GTPase